MEILWQVVAQLNDLVETLTPLIMAGIFLAFISKFIKG